MKRKTIFGLIFAFLLLIATACNDSNETGNIKVNNDESKKNITLKLAVSQPETHPINVESIKPFMKKVTELTDGQVDFEFYPAEQLGKAADLLDLTSDGVTDIGFYIGSYYPSQMPIGSSLMGIPGLYSTAYEGTLAYHELNKKNPVLESDFLSNGVRPLFSYAAPSSGIWSTGKEIKVPEDVKGLKVRVSGELTNKAVLALNASPINLTASELYEGFERGVYDSIILNAASTKDYGLGELTKYGTNEVDFGGLGVGLVINEKVFQGLPKNVQEVLVQVGDEITESNAVFYDDYTQSVIQEFKDSGVKIHELSEDEKAKWQKFYHEIEASWIKEQNNPDFKATLDAFKEKVKK